MITRQKYMEIIRICDKHDAVEMSKAGILEGFIESSLPPTGTLSLSELKVLLKEFSPFVGDPRPIASIDFVKMLRGENVALEIGDDVRILHHVGGDLTLMRRIGGLWVAEPVGKELKGWATAENLFPQHNVKELCSQNELDRQNKRGNLRNFLVKLYISIERENGDMWFRVGDHMVWHNDDNGVTDVYEGEDELSMSFSIKRGWCRSSDIERLVNLAESHVTRKTFGPF